MLYLLKCKIYGEVPYVRKAKTKFQFRFDNCKSKHRAFRKGNQKVPQKRFHAHYCVDGHSGIDDCNFVIFEQCETHEQLTKRETFYQNRLKTFYSIVVNEKVEYLPLPCLFYLILYHYHNCILFIYSFVYLCLLLFYVFIFWLFFIFLFLCS